MQASPYLNFSGTCEAAFKFYEQCLGGKIVMMMTHRNSPMAEQTPADLQDTIMHARLTFGDNVLMGSDSPPQYFSRPAGFSVSLMFDSAAEAERVYQALSEGGSVDMPIQETFWADRFAMFTDKFGIPWMINSEKAA